MRKVKFQIDGMMEVRIFFGTEEIEIEVPDDIEEDEIEEYIEKSKEHSNAINIEIDYIHSTLKNADIEYKERGGEDEINVIEEDE